MIDVEKVVQAFAVQVYAQALDIVQQLDPLPANAVDAHEDRVNLVIADVSDGLLALTQADLEAIGSGLEPQWAFPDGLPFHVAVALQRVLEKRIRAAVIVCDTSDLEPLSFIHATGKYLENPDDHKRAWLAERAAHLLVAGG